MTDLRVIPAEPWAEARERYRELACEDRPGDPWSVPFMPRRSAGWWIGNVASASACTLFVAFMAALLWSAS